ncbi:MAG: aspartate aminotransferase family protein [Elusimicrobiota bacterium]|jgi:4-aminobutyrate aminotransferase/(S)-3-amino-2-methylpropionate transaminase|nr:aspartate aminotransferase family protein [Elusimicrobiota bacterium]
MLKDEMPKIKTALPGPKAKEVIDRRANAVAQAMRCAYPCVIKRGEGAVVEDVDGNIFLDWVGGVGVLNIGYSHPEVVAAVKEQADNYFHAMVNIISHRGYIELAEKLNSIAPLKSDKQRKTMFVNSGAEAVENAVKIARSASKRPNIIVFSGAFHGRTLLAATMTSKKAYYNGMGPLPDGIYRAEFPYLYRAPKGLTKEEAVSYYIRRLESVFEEDSPAEYVAAIVIEPVQGEGGFIPAPKEWVQAVRKICDDNGVLLVADEIQTGFARSGKMFVSNYWKEWQAAPDIIITAKSLAAGLPLGAVTTSAEILDKVKPGVLGGTYGGNALSCAAALKTIEIIERDKLADRSLEISERCKSEFEKWQKEYFCIGDIRGIGSMMGIEFVKEDLKPFPELVTAIIQEAVQNGLIIENAGIYGNVIRFLSPLVISDAQLEKGLEIFKKAIDVCVSKLK